MHCPHYHPHCSPEGIEIVLTAKFKLGLLPSQASEGLWGKLDRFWEKECYLLWISAGSISTFFTLVGMQPSWGHLVTWRNLVMDIISHWSFFHIWGTVETWNSEKKEMSLSSGKHGFLSVTALLLKSGVTPGTLLQLHSQFSLSKRDAGLTTPAGLCR